LKTLRKQAEEKCSAGKSPHITFTGCGKGEMMNRHRRRIVLAALLMAALILPTAAAQAQDSSYFQRYEPEPSAAWMMLDTVAFRPAGIVTTVGGIGLLVGTLPITLATGTTQDAARAFVERPGRWTFQRPLGRRGYDRTFWLP
jgi:hypothetical protein